jgi:hypothetical protein
MLAIEISMYYSPPLFELTFFLAIASCSSIWFCKCFSRFDSISSVLLRPKMAFLVLSFFFAALPPQRLPNPQLAMLSGVEVEVDGEESHSNLLLLSLRDRLA